MSVRVDSSIPVWKGREDSRRGRGLKLARAITGALYYAALFLLLICAVALAKLVAVDGGGAGWVVTASGELLPWAASAALFAQLACGFLAYWVAARQARAVVSRAAESGTVFCAQSGRHLRVAAGAFLFLALAELAFSLLYLACQGQPLLPLNLGFGFSGFPADWQALTAGGGGTAFTAQLDVTALVVACFLWGLSHAFDCGAELQSEQDATI
ncbi:MAG: hypothetical protein ACI36Y_09535 [Coriobacteriales bacterium]